MHDLVQVDPQLLAKLNRAVPRYTSYPTAPQFQPIDESAAIRHLRLFDASNKPLSLYFHIPFCKSMCLFCGCSVVLNRKPERQQLYLDHLCQEIDLVARNISNKRLVTQLHLGGGTPTSLNEEEFDRLMKKIHEHFVFSEDAEISIEVDPRTVFADRGRKLTFLRQLGFNRVSFGVQDLDPVVQEAVRRRQSEEMTVTTYYKARELGFEGINIDLIYGLPHQTVERFAKTADRLIELKPDRIAFYSYAKVPWLKEHQKAIPDETLPSTEEKFRIYVDARTRFMQGGYAAIGMDHFALSGDPMAKAYFNKTLTRNFQGYAVQMAEDMIGFGLTAIGYLENAYFQNIKELEIYQSTVASGHLPVAKGYVLTEDDLARRKIILSLMCHFEVGKEVRSIGVVEPLIQEGLLEERGDKLLATPIGRLFIRNIASVFDAYLSKGHFSKAV
ncbi:MAG: oxygen-independent coproporphyrinogen III oxidase [Parachlamydiales bacterium]|nr:oxygen-independent coproporphyrinogen III oxidase [Parachlamydiales bacterium]